MYLQVFELGRLSGGTPSSRHEQQVFRTASLLLTTRRLASPSVRNDPETAPRFKRPRKTSKEEWRVRWFASEWWTAKKKTRIRTTSQNGSHRRAEKTRQTEPKDPTDADLTAVGASSLFDWIHPKTSCMPIHAIQMSITEQPADVANTLWDHLW